MLNLNNNCFNIPTKITENDKELKDSKEIAKAFCKYFSNIGNEIAASIPTINKSPLDYLDKSHLDSFFILPTSTQEIEEEILKLKNDKAVGPFSIPVRILKIIRHVVSRPLEAIFNLSFSTGIVPSSLKIANWLFQFSKRKVVVTQIIIVPCLCCLYLISY